MQENKNRDEQQGGAGRSNESTRQEQHPGRPVSNDISEVDRQEGDMHNGALGGNFNQDSSGDKAEEASLEQQRKEAFTERD